jgi:hypothetical protein
VPTLLVCMVEPPWLLFCERLPERPIVAPRQAMVRDRRWAPDRSIFEHLSAALTYGSGDERIASPGCSGGGIRRWPHEWTGDRLIEQEQTLMPHECEHMVRLDLDELAEYDRAPKEPRGAEAAVLRRTVPSGNPNARS